MSEDRAEYGLLKPFDIDHGELDGLRPQDCFVLGYELCMIDEMLKRPEPIKQAFHAENKARVERACRDAKREFGITWMPGDVSESWMMLAVR